MDDVFIIAMKNYGGRIHGRKKTTQAKDIDEEKEKLTAEVSDLWDNLNNRIKDGKKEFEEGMLNLGLNLRECVDDGETKKEK